MHGWNTVGPVRAFRPHNALEDAIGSSTCSLEARMRATNGMPLGFCHFFLTGFKFRQNTKGALWRWVGMGWCLSGWYGARFRRKFPLEDAIGSHACSLEASMRVTNGIPLGCSLLLLLPL
jgi:hypothetical protein